MIINKKAINSALFKLNFSVVICSSVFILLVGIMLIFYPVVSKLWLHQIKHWVTEIFSWYFMLLMVGCMIFVFWLALSRFGHIRLSHKGEKPQFSYISWVAMLFSAGIGIALIYYGVYEPLAHFLTPPEGDGGNIQAARDAMVLTFLHWGLHGWALYALIATVLAWFTYCRGLPLVLRSPLRLLFGKYINGWAGHLIDSFGILVTVISMVTNLGIGALLVNSGISYLFHVQESANVLLTIIIIMMAIATLTIIFGIEKGIAILSNINIFLLCLLLLFVFVTGPTISLINGLVQNTGTYLNSLISKSFDLYLYGGAGQWLSSWTLFYWAWWIAWAPFVGLFIARISKGRTIRELVFGVLFIPLGFTLTWLSVFGNSAISLILEKGHVLLGEIALVDPPMSVFKFFEYLPYSNIISCFILLISITLFLTPVNSAILMITNLSCQGDSDNADAPVWLRVFWASLITLLCAGLLYAGSFSEIQIAVVLCGLPFSVVLVLYMISLYKDLRIWEAENAPFLVRNKANAH